MDKPCQKWTHRTRNRTKSESKPKCGKPAPKTGQNHVKKMNKPCQKRTNRTRNRTKSETEPKCGKTAPKTWQNHVKKWTNHAKNGHTAHETVQKAKPNQNAAKLRLKPGKTTSKNGQTMPKMDTPHTKPYKKRNRTKMRQNCAYAIANPCQSKATQKSKAASKPQVSRENSG